MMLQTPLHYVTLFQSSGILFASDSFTDGTTGEIVECKELNDNYSHAKIQILEDLKHYAKYFANLALHDYFLLQFKEEIIALACVMCARRICKVTSEYSENFMKMYEISNDEVDPAFQRLWTFHHK
jgi:hypothetical protein